MQINFLNLSYCSAYEGNDSAFMNIPIRVSTESAEPLYHQIKEQLRALIVSGQLVENSLLPSIRDLAQQVACSVITIKRVYQDLENEGLLRTKQGTGTFVAAVGQINREKFKYDAVYKEMKEAVRQGRSVQCSNDEMRAILERTLAEND
jgi:GntR family transcriptional regulator